MAVMSKDIQALNDMVDLHTAKALAQAKDSNSEPSIEYEFAQKSKSILYAGTPIYEDRMTSIVYGVTAIVTGIALKSSLELGVLPTLIMSLLMFVMYDFYSGVLHIVLDHPPFVRLPLLGQPCLEFQWHHIIPDDLCRKSFALVCGDLNVAVLAMLPLNYIIWADWGKDSLVAFLIAAKVLMAYLGQWSHRQAHQVSRAKRGPVTQFLQEAGILTSVGQHHKHHTPPHNTNFCLIGLCNKGIGALYSSTSAEVQLAFFAFMTVFDVPILAYVLRKTLFDF
jgi:hypothetical protein